MHWTLPLRPSRSARDAITCRAVAKDHTIGPVGVVLVELGLGILRGQTIEIGEHVDLVLVRIACPFRDCWRRSSMSALGCTRSWI